MATGDLCRKHGISSATFSNWKAKYGGLEVSEARRLRSLEDENRRLKKLLAKPMGGGCRPKKIVGQHRDWLLERCRGHDFTLRGLVGELAERGVQVDYRTVWDFVHSEKLTYKKGRWSPASATGRM